MSEVRVRDSFDLRLNDWRKQEKLVGEAQRVLNLGSVKAMLDVLQNEHPCHSVLSVRGFSADDRAAHQAKVEGYELCLNNIRALAVLSVPKTRLESSFEPEPETALPKNRR